MKKASLKRILVGRIIGVVVVIILIGAIFLLGNRVQNVRRELLVKQFSLEGSLKDAVYKASLKDQLIEHETAIARVEAMMPTQDEVGSIISYVENESKKFGVTVKVPVVQEDIIKDKNGNIIKQTGPTQTVRMQIHAQGDPVALVSFMHSIEHMPYLLGTEAFSFDSDSDSVARGSVIRRPGSRPPGEESARIETRRAILRMEVKLTTRVGNNIEEYEKN